MNCHKVSQLLSAFMDSELPGVEHRQIHMHLARCGDCHTEYEELLQLKRLLSGMRIKEALNSTPNLILTNVANMGDQNPSTQLTIWMNQIRHSFDTAISYPHLIGVGVGLTFVGILFTTHLAISQTGPSPARQMKFTRAEMSQESAEPGSALINGLDQSATDRFLRQHSYNGSADYKQINYTGATLPAPDGFPFQYRAAQPGIQLLSYPNSH